MNLNQKLILGLSFGCVILITFVKTNDKSNFNPSYSSVQSVGTLNSGAQNRLSGNTPKISVPQTSLKAINKLEILIKHFPDWEERMNYQKKTRKILSVWFSSNYRSRTTWNKT